MSERVQDRWLQVAAAAPRSTALIYLGTRYSYGWLADAVDRFAAGLARLGVRRGDPVLLVLGNTPQWAVAHFALLRLGAISVPVSPVYTAREIGSMASQTGATLAICTDVGVGHVRDAGIARVVVTNLVDLLPGWKRLVGRLLDRVPTGRVPRDPDVVAFRSVLRATDSPPLAGPAADVQSIHFTGGTTAAPKGVPVNHATEVAYVRDVMDDVLAGHLRQRDVLVLVAPLFHIMAKGLFLAAGLNQGHPTVLLPFPHIDALLAAIARERGTVLLGVPALYRMILDNDRADRYDLSSLRLCLCGGDVLPDSIFTRWRDRTGLPIHQVYGATEVGHLAYSDLAREPRPDVVGRPLKSYRCRVVDPETLREVPENEVGELIVTAPHLVCRYWNRPDETARSFVRLDDATWYRMGDHVRWTADGLQFVERTADLIKHKGYGVSASEVEAVLAGHPSVLEACVIGVPDEGVGERIKAIVVLDQDAPGVSGAELRRWCRERLAPYKIPGRVEFRDVLPKSKVGKLLRREIREEERRRRGQAR